ncbi:MAG: dihydroorotase [Pseudobdellovibrionaceae bacterium]
MKHDLLIKNAEALVFKDGKIQKQQIAVAAKDGKISHLGSSHVDAEQILDAQGLHLLPGVIDSQVHFREPGLTHKEDLESGTRGALLGGVTSIFEMPNTVPATTTEEAFQNKMAAAAGRCWTHYAFFVGGSPENVETLQHLEQLPGCSGIKIFMGSSTGSLLVEDDPTLEKIFRSGKRRVILHSEDEYVLRERKKLVIESKKITDHPVWRNVESALSSTKRLLALSEKTGRPVHVLHVTSQEEMELLFQEKQKLPRFGRVTVEVLPNHLSLWAPDCYERLGTYAQQNPPIREKRHWEALWKAVNNGTVDVLGSDHAPHTREEKDKEYPGTPSGMPGVQTLVPIMLNHVHEGRLSLEKFVELACENQRHVFGCFQKGRIELGLDADFTLVDLKKKKKIEKSWIASRVGWTPFDGLQVTGWPTHSILMGQVRMSENQLLGSPAGQKVLFQK